MWDDAVPAFGAIQEFYKKITSASDDDITGTLSTRQMIKANRFSPAIRNTLRIILQKAYSNKE